MDKNKPQELIVSEFSDSMIAGLSDAGLGPDELREYEIADPAWMNAQGLIRYWQKRWPADCDTP